MSFKSILTKISGNFNLLTYFSEGDTIIAFISEEEQNFSNVDFDYGDLGVFQEDEDSAISFNLSLGNLYVSDSGDDVSRFSIDDDGYLIEEIDD